MQSTAQAKRLPIVVRLILAISACLATVILGITVTSRMTAAPVVDIPDQFLPGNPLPDEAKCETPSCTTYSYLVKYQDKNVFLLYNPTGKIITQATMSAHEYT